MFYIYLIAPKSVWHCQVCSWKNKTKTVTHAPTIHPSKASMGYNAFVCLKGMIHPKMEWFTQKWNFSHLLTLMLMEVWVFWSTKHCWSFTQKRCCRNLNYSEWWSGFDCKEKYVKHLRWHWKPVQVLLTTQKTDHESISDRWAELVTASVLIKILAVLILSSYCLHCRMLQHSLTVFILPQKWKPLSCRQNGGLGSDRSTSGWPVRRRLCGN